jgi:ribosomal protein S3
MHERTEVLSEKQEITTPVIYMKVDVKSAGCASFRIAKTERNSNLSAKAFKPGPVCGLVHKVGIFA